VRRHAKASSSGPNERKPSGQGGSSSGRLRLTILLATVAAFLLVPAAQAFAGEMHVTIAGTGEGSITGFFLEGSPPLACTGNGSSQSGTCSNNLNSAEECEGALNSEEQTLVSGECEYLDAAVAHEGAEEFKEWVITEGSGKESAGNPCGPEGAAPFAESHCILEGAPNVKAKAVFCLVGESLEECLPAPTGPTNLRTLTVHNSGNGTVSSKPKGIKCGPTCSFAEAKMFENTVVTLEAKPGTEATFTGWSETAGTCTGTTTPCQVTMSEAHSLTAAFSAGKAIVNPQTLTLTKVGDERGKGTVKATGLTCEAECTKTAAAYFGGTEGPKAKPAALVTLKQAPAFGSAFGGWSGCTEEKEGNCIVSMSSAKEVTAEYTLLPTQALSLSRSGNGTVSTKPKGIKCGPTCSAASAAFPEGAVITVEAKPGTEATFTGWSSGAGTCTGTTTPCQVTMSEAHSLTAAFSAGKAIINPQTLTLTKAGTGFGTVKATGLTCEVLCTSTAAAYFGGTEGPKAKPAALVTLSAVSAPGSKTVEWSGCTEEKEGHCIVSMSAAKEVTATFNELE
jgi:hypothetical protein